MPKSRSLIGKFRQFDNTYAAILHKNLNLFAKQEGHPGIHAQSMHDYAYGDVVTTTVTFSEDPELPKLQIQYFEWGANDVIISKVTQHQQPDGTTEKSFELLDRISHRHHTFETPRDAVAFVCEHTTKYVQSFMDELGPEKMTPLTLPNRPLIPGEEDYQTIVAAHSLAGIARLAAKNGLQIGKDIHATSVIDDSPYNVGLTTKATIELGDAPHNSTKLMNSCEITKITPSVHGWDYVDTKIQWAEDVKTIHDETYTKSKDGTGIRVSAEDISWRICEVIRKPLREIVASRAIADAIELPDEPQL